MSTITRNAKVEVLVYCALEAECHLSAEPTIVDLHSVAVEAEQRLANSHEVTYPRDERDDALSALRECDEQVYVGCEYRWRTCRGVRRRAPLCLGR